ncbi:carbamoyl-phosphate synthase large subunit [Niveispirillum cyanobacteriorum]|uniref:Carbamoyl phosphate synthase large chain n=1 Tax=Niveispirillum cyanobacteriorum TaxID=1612173 RepID=A0A2K9NBM3_9PROT|nr:carbamoyl-phosphate synthase large subunit [Niveispirillum cyanobacteriorum]AUN29926.1 carbamoyl phosphate synthase large subunit [Niveispirillum cyanobacteriorum]GGE59509.1 carbamoyl-phosphate synthase (glutamine-hydrolyzing) [Niveispirillum cyanobacteriorum]
MPKRTDIKSICIIGAGPIIIGQACEFDYSGVQACKALKEEGYRVILVNSNPATIMTDPGLADATYIEPITPAVVAKILEKERPDALLPTMGGQTALNTALALFHNGTLERLGIEMIGAKADVIEKAEDRLKFRDAMDKIGLESPRSRVVKNFDEALDALAFVGLPAIIRPSFTLAGTGGGIAFNRAEFEDIVRGGLRASPVNEVLIEESVLGWKEYEMEVVRDSKDNCIIICSIENIDAMGVHTGDSMTVAPALTLTDKEYQIMRNASLTVLREIGVDTGGSNVQFGIHPDTGRMVVIEMNPRVSRSSALASKATGFPIAKIAAKLAVGYTLDELDNDITGSTPASFEPTIDYVVTKIPRFAFEKFPGADNTLTTSMKSVGEVMAIGRTFAESMQKALRGLETGLNGFDEIDLRDANGNVDQGRLRHMLSRPTPERLLIVAQAMRHGWTVEQIYEECKYDPWFMRQIEAIVQEEAAIKAAGLSGIDAQYMARIKAMGFSDARLASLLGQPEAAVAAHRRALNVRPVFKRIDTCAAEFASDTPYMYSTYEGNGLEPAECEAEPTDKKKVVILGGGPNRIGQGIEFDYCCVHAVYALQEAGYETIMVNCNPETVSTDYDTADRLYFEPLTAEDVIELVEKEKQNGEVVGLIVQFGGQTPLKLAKALEQAGLPILGTTPDAIDLAEDRERFQQLLHKLELRQPANGLARSLEEAVAVAEKIGFPVVIRPSYVLGGRAMEIVHDMAGLHRYIATAVKVSGNNPVLIDSYLQNAIEVDVDAVADADGEVYVAGIMEHIEEAGIHSGDSACALPPYTLSKPVIDELTVQAVKLAKGLNVVGLMNIQFAVKQSTDGSGIGGYDIYILEVNPRASRTVPFVAKATGTAIAKIAARVMAGEKLSQFKLSGPFPPHTAVKEAVFPFNRFPGVDILLGPEMRSTGEVMGLDKNFGLAFAKSQMGAGVTLPKEGTVFISVRDGDKGAMVPVAAKLLELGFKVIATRGTAKHLADNGVKVTAINKVVEGQPHIVDAMINGDVQLIFNTTEGSQAVSDSFSLRRAALTNNIPYYTTVAGAEAAVEAISALKVGGLDVAPLQSYLSGTY